MPCSGHERLSKDLTASRPAFTACTAVAAGEEAAPLLYGPKAQVRRALQASHIRYTFIVAYGLAPYWANGLGELGTRGRVPLPPEAWIRSPTMAAATPDVSFSTAPPEP